MLRFAVVSFSDAGSAGALIAGVPAAARAVGACAEAGFDGCRLVVPGGVPQDIRFQDDLERFRGGLILDPQIDSGELVLWVSGETLVEPADLRAGRLNKMPLADGVAIVPFGEAGSLVGRGHAWRARYDAVAAAVMAATAKPGDGIVSRVLNRPVSRAISALLLRWPAVRPDHVTAVTAVLAVLMFAALVMEPSRAGLVTGALLFQAASIIDGVDGEIARATRRTSTRGALLDSTIDAATNLAFVGGLVIHAFRAGDTTGALYGAVGLMLLAIGLSVLGRRARLSKGPFTFNAVKDRFIGTESPMMRFLVWLTMRDSLALAAVVLVLAGLITYGLVAFSVVMAGWLVVVLATPPRVVLE